MLRKHLTDSDSTARYAQVSVVLPDGASTTVRHELYPWPNSSIVVQYIPTLGWLSRRWNARPDGLIKRPAAL